MPPLVTQLEVGEQQGLAACKAVAAGASKHLSSESREQERKVAVAATMRHKVAVAAGGCSLTNTSGEVVSNSERDELGGSSSRCRLCKRQRLCTSGCVVHVQVTMLQHAWCYVQAYWRNIALQQAPVLLGMVAAVRSGLLDRATCMCGQILGP
jgi:hypothetical protein